MEEHESWRSLLANIIQNPQTKQQLAVELKISHITLTRWANNQSQPRPQNLQQLVQALPYPVREQMMALLQEEFPDILTEVEAPQPTGGALQEIPSDFYTKAIATYASTPFHQRFWSVCNHVLPQALEQLDADKLGMAISIAQCVPPAPGHKVRTLRESIGRGHPPWPSHLEHDMLFLGAESLAGYAITQGHPIIYQDADTQEYSPAHWVTWEKGAAAYPILHQDSAVGSVIVSTTQKNYFLPYRQKLIQDYTNLLLLAFSPTDYQHLQDIDLRPLPNYVEQRKYFANFRQRVSDYMREKKMPVDQAELQVWQEIEEELIRHELDKGENGVWRDAL
jgi:transcriptional regulator with XRE-family HTH domain